MENNMAAKV